MSWFMDRCGTSRSDRQVPAYTHLRARRALEVGEAVCGFPEAGISHSYTVRPLMRAGGVAGPGHRCPAGAGRDLGTQRIFSVGDWIDNRQSARSLAPAAAIAFRFHARDLHLVLGSSNGKPVRFTVTLDGKAPGADAGVDVKPDGSGVVTGQRLYQLVRQKGAVRDHSFTITFLDPGVEAFSFTFG